MMMLTFRRPNPRRASVVRLAAAALLAAITLLGAAAPAAAEESLFAPFAAVTFGGDTRKKGATFGFSTAYIEDSGWGGEFDLAYVTDFNDRDFESTSIATAMINLMVAPKLPWTKRIRPYGVAGLGLIRARGCSRPSCVTEFSRTDLGIDAGGGVMVPFNDVLGVRGDIRYFRFATIHRDIPRTGNGQFDFWRIAGGGVVTW
jgi:opacity protein-like surface antigen